MKPNDQHLPAKRRNPKTNFTPPIIDMGKLFALLVFLLLTYQLNAQSTYMLNGRLITELNGKCFSVTNGDTTHIGNQYITIKHKDNQFEKCKSQLTSIGLKFRDRPSKSYSLFQLPGNTKYIETIARIEKLESVQYCIPDLSGHQALIPPTGYPTNDPLPGTSTDYTFWFGSNDEGVEPQERYLNIDGVWQLTKGNPSVKIAIIDNGVGWGSEDMPSNNYLGKNFVDNNNNTQAVCGPNYTGNRHGSIMTSIICAQSNNAIGNFGVAGGWTNNGVYTPGITPMALVVHKEHVTDDPNYFAGGPMLAHLPSAIRYAADNGAKVILIPLAFFNLTEIEKEPTKQAIDEVLADLCNPVTIVAAAGNSTHTMIPDPNYLGFPASYTPVISVSGVTEDHELYNYESYQCHYGANLDFVAGVSAPGINGPCVANTFYYSSVTGSSVAAALLAGSIGLMYSVNPDLTSLQIMELLKSACYVNPIYPTTNGWSPKVGYGFPDIRKAIDNMELVSTEVSTTQWNFNRISGNIHIEANNTLTLNNITLTMLPHTKIIIKPGGKLIVNNSTITSCPNKTWKGIQVWGNKNANQYPNAQGNYQQGYLELNNSTVMNAEVAVDLWRPKDYTKTGGIIKATGSHFINNANAVHALRYKNIHPGNGMETNYIAQFNNCNFQITSTYLAANKTFYKHIDLDHVKGPNFVGCDFSLAPNVNNVSSWNQAIASYSSGFSITGPCITPNTQNCTSFDYSNISGFRWGINASKDVNADYTYTVNRAIFTNNVYGILNMDVKNQKVINSKFYLGNANAQYSTDCNFGIYMNSSNGFTIENNEFYKMTGAPQAVYTGIFTANTNAMDDIYRNTFDGMSFGNLATKQNWITDYRHFGLEYLCNNNTNNWADFYVYNIESGIQDQQGSYTQAAGNKFSGSSTNMWHFYNTKAAGNHEIGYYYNQNAPLEIPAVSKVNYVTIHGIDYCNTCPDHFGNSSSVSILSTTEINALSTTHDNAKAQLQALDMLYKQLTDGGSTPIKLTEIQAANETQMWSLRSTLLANSPYLSDTVLREVASRTSIFPDAIIFEILAANPEALRNRNLIIYLAEKTNPLPDYMIGILEQVASQNTTYKTILQQQMSQYAREANRAANKVIDSYLNDTILDVASLNTWLIKKGGIEADKQRIALMVANNDYTGAMDLAEDLPVIYSLNLEALNNYTAWFDLLSLQKTLHDSNRDWSQLTETERTYLESVANSNFPEAAAIAQGILGYNYNTGFDHCFDIDEPGALKHKAITPQDIAKAYGMTIEVNPNPAKEWAEFTYTLPVNEKSGEINVIDMQGREVYSITVSDGQGKKIWDTRTFKSGTYIYTYKSGKYSLSGKIVVSK